VFYVTLVILRYLIQCEHSRKASYHFYSTPDGFYVVNEAASPTAISRFTVQLDPAINQVKGATCVCVATVQLSKYYPMGGHVTALAYSDDHKLLFIWGGQQVRGIVSGCKISDWSVYNDNSL